jgi:hypothetical protein
MKVKSMKWHATLGVVMVLAALTAIGLHSRITSANDIAPYQTVFRTDVTAAGYGGMRTIGTGTISLTGVSGTVTQALLYWHGPTDSTSPSANASVTFAGTPITGTNIGFSADNCWDYDNSQAYRADVTSLVTGNGGYSLANFIKQNVEINGASLIVFFDDGNDTNNRDVVLFDGNDSNIENSYDADGWNVTLSGINYTSGNASIVLHVSDGQTANDAAVILNGTTPLSAPGAVFQGVSVPNGASAGQTNGGLWDIKSYNVTAELTPGPNTLTLTTGVYPDHGDCLSLVVAAINLPAGAAPTATPEPSTHRRAASTPTPKPPTATPLPPMPTSLPTLPAPNPPMAPVGGVGTQIAAPSTGSGPPEGNPYWLLATWLLVGGAGATVAGGLCLRLGRRGGR